MLIITLSPKLGMYHGELQACESALTTDRTARNGSLWALWRRGFALGLALTSWAAQADPVARVCTPSVRAAPIAEFPTQTGSVLRLRFVSDDSRGLPSTDHGRVIVTPVDGRERESITVTVPFNEGVDLYLPAGTKSVTVASLPQEGKPPLFPARRVLLTGPRSLVKVTLTSEPIVFAAEGDLLPFRGIPGTVALRSVIGVRPDMVERFRDLKQKPRNWGPFKLKSPLHDESPSLDVPVSPWNQSSPQSQLSPLALSPLELGASNLVLERIGQSDDALKELSQIRSELGRPQEIGLAFVGTDLRTTIVVADDFVVRRSPSSDIERLWGYELNGNRAVVPIRQLDQAGRFWQVRLLGDTLPAIENIRNCLIEDGIIEDGESNASRTSTSFGKGAQKRWPNEDAYWSQQLPQHHGWHRIRDAWSLLMRGKVPHDGSSPSSTSIEIASLDVGVVADHPELSANCPTGAPISTCFSTETNLFCHEPGYSLHSKHGKAERRFNVHGLNVFGVISACTNNQSDPGPRSGQIAGIAPGVRHAAIQISVAPSAIEFGDALLMTAGLALSCPIDGSTLATMKPASCDWNAHGKVAARVINVSRDMPLDAARYLSESVFPRIALDGAQGKGTLVVAASGPSVYEIADDNLIAAPAVLGVGGCIHRDDAGHDERKFDRHEGPYGRQLGICSVGHGIATISTAAQEFPDRRSPPDDAQPVFSGTSAAAAVVTGIAALTVSAAPNITARQLKCVLQATADRGVQSGSQTEFGMTYGERPRKVVPCQWNGERSPCFGAGLVDAFGAVAGAIDSASGSARSCFNED